MEAIMKRSIRRHHYYRLKNKRKYYHGYYLVTGARVSTPKPCSCSCCGNPRRHFNEKTRKEIINNINFKEQCLDIDYYVS